MFQLRYAFILLLFFFSPAVVAAASLDERVTEHRLDNGLTVLLLERHSAPTVSAYISFAVGSVDETSRQRGVAHLLEHMLFKGTRTLGTTDFAAERPLLRQIEEVGRQLDALKIDPVAHRQRLEQLRQELEQLQQEHRQFVVKDEFARIYAEHGGVGYNAFTSKDQTSYLINLPANKLELWAAIESDRLQNAVFREFYTERDVVLEERYRAIEVNPSRKLYENLLATAYQVHPYRHPIIGWQSDIAFMTPDTIRTFFGSYYAPANMVITLVGAFDSDEALTLVERYFGSLPPGEKVPPVTAKEPQQKGERRVKVTFDAEPRMMVAYHKPTLPHADDYVFDLLGQALTGGRSSRLYQSLVVDKQLVTDVSIFTAPGSRYDNLLIVSLLPRRGVTFARLEQALDEEFQQLLRNPLTTEEMEQARRQILTSLLRGMQSNSGLARMLSSYQILGNWRYLVDYEEKLKRVTTEDVSRAVTDYLHADNRVVAQLSREGEQ